MTPPLTPEEAAVVKSLLKLYDAAWKCTHRFRVEHELRHAIEALGEHAYATFDSLKAKVEAGVVGVVQGDGIAWRDVNASLPTEGARVIAKYAGVYDARIVTFWWDEGGNPHFGLPNEDDGKGSQPATHWMPQP
jgi:hypothetical protein